MLGRKRFFLGVWSPFATLETSGTDLQCWENTENRCDQLPHFEFVAPLAVSSMLSISRWLWVARMLGRPTPGRQGAPLTADFGLKTPQWPCRTFLRLHGSLGGFHPICLCLSVFLSPALHPVPLGTQTTSLKAFPVLGYPLGRIAWGM